MVELFIYLGEPCHVCQVLLTISHGVDDSTYPSTVDVRTGRYLDGLKLVVEVLSLSYISLLENCLDFIVTYFYGGNDMFLIIVGMCLVGRSCTSTVYKKIKKHVSVGKTRILMMGIQFSCSST